MAALVFGMAGAALGAEFVVANQVSITLMRLIPSLGYSLGSAVGPAFFGPQAEAQPFPGPNLDGAH